MNDPKIIEQRWRVITRNVLDTNPTPDFDCFNCELYKKQVRELVLREVSEDAVDNYYDNFDITFEVVGNEAMKWLSEKDLVFC